MRSNQDRRCYVQQNKLESTFNMLIEPNLAKMDSIVNNMICFVKEIFYKFTNHPLFEAVVRCSGLNSLSKSITKDIQKVVDEYNILLGNLQTSFESKISDTLAKFRLIIDDYLIDEGFGDQYPHGGILELDAINYARQAQDTRCAQLKEVIKQFHIHYLQTSKHDINNSAINNNPQQERTHLIFKSQKIEEVKANSVKSMRQENESAMIKRISKAEVLVQETKPLDVVPLMPTEVCGRVVYYSGSDVFTVDGIKLSDKCKMLVGSHGEYIVCEEENKSFVVKKVIGNNATEVWRRTCDICLIDDNNLIYKVKGDNHVKSLVLNNVSNEKEGIVDANVASAKFKVGTLFNDYICWSDNSNSLTHQRIDSQPFADNVSIKQLRNIDKVIFAIGQSSGGNLGNRLEIAALNKNLKIESLSSVILPANLKDPYVLSAITAKDGVTALAVAAAKSSFITLTLYTSGTIILERQIELPKYQINGVDHITLVNHCSFVGGYLYIGSTQVPQKLFRVAIFE